LPPPTDPRTDAELVAAINAGDTAAFDALYYRHRDWVVRLAARWTGNDADALDVLQETFAYVVGKFPHLHLTAAMTTFLYPVVCNLSIAARKKRARFVGHDPAFASVWARTKIADLADRSTWEPRNDLPAEIRQVALEHGLMSAYTAFVAVDSSSKTAGDHGTTVAVPLPVPAGVRYDMTVVE
jgi:DNA-directed RNA polymerase specialized sigma24 family protein